MNALEFMDYLHNNPCYSIMNDGARRVLDELNSCFDHELNRYSVDEVKRILNVLMYPEKVGQRPLENVTQEYYDALHWFLKMLNNT